jgi:hypothetical protein
VALLNRSSIATFIWPTAAVAEFAQSPASHPLLACLVLHTGTKHVIQEGGEFPLKAVRLALWATRLRFDWFSEPKVLLCADHLGLGRQRELYLSSSSTGIRSREHFESLVFPYVESRLAVSVGERNAFRWRAALTSIIFELFENTDLHGRTDWDGRVLQNSIRGLIFKDVTIDPYLVTRKQSGRKLRCLEIGVFDSGVGYFSKSRQRPLTDEVSIKDEWEVLHYCLSTHLEDGTAPGVGEGQRGIGLYEVLRALKFLNGAIELRTGRLHAYRSFLPGDLPLQLESPDSRSRPKMPKPRLLDFRNKYFPVPSVETITVGSAVKVLIPLI